MSAIQNAEKARVSHVWKRDSLDWYVEPVDATTALLRVERFITIRSERPRMKERYQRSPINGADKRSPPRHWKDLERKRMWR